MSFKILSILILFLFSCNNIEKTQKDNISETIQHDYADNYITDSLMILAPNRIYNLRQSEKDTRLFYYISNDSLMEYYLDSNKYNPIVSVHKLNRIIDFYPVNYDSIFLLCRYSNSIVLINNKADIKKTYKIPLDSRFYTLYSTSSKPFHISKNRIAFFAKSTTQMVNTNYKYYKWVKEKKEIIYDLKSEKIISIDEYIDLPVDIHNVKFANISQTNVDDTVVYYSFYYSDTVYKLNINQKKIETKLIRSKYYLPNDKYDTINFTDREYNEKYFTTYNGYLFLKCDKFRNNICRIFIHKGKDNDNNLCKNWSVIICDNDLNIRNEFFFKGKKYGRFLFIIISKGVLIEEYETVINPKNNVHKFKVFNF